MEYLMTIYKGDTEYENTLVENKRHTFDNVEQAKQYGEKELNKLKEPFKYYIVEVELDNGDFEIVAEGGN